MKIHWVGDRRSSGPALIMTDGNSLAVRQFMELARGERPVARPQNRFEVVLVIAEPRYCLKCLRVQIHDVVFSVGYEAACRCRFCGKEDGECLMGNHR
jgi:hypothetical protein